MIAKKIKGYEKLYTIDYNGNIKSIKKDIFLKADISSGYKRVILQNKGKKERYLVHRLVAMHYCNGYFDGAIVNHIDGNKQNNHYTNLEWCNQSHNILQSINNTKTRDIATKHKQKNNSSGYIGVIKKDDIYLIQIRYKGKTIYTKYGFKTAIECAKHRDEYLKENNLPHRRNFND